MYRYSADLWELFGVRLWHADDLAHLEAGMFEGMKRAADARRTEIERARREADSGRRHG